MTILDQIISDKIKEIALKKQVISVSQLEKSELFKRLTYSLSTNLQKSDSGIIAEHKRRSPSKSVINQSLNCFDVVSAYEKAGASGVSVLTDGKYFGGSLDDLLVARASCSLPILRKDFIIDPYQIFEAKAFGADVILLISSVLTKNQLKEFAKIATDLGLEVLCEIHNEAELEKSLHTEIKMMGVNNRNLSNFKVDLAVSEMLCDKIPADFVKISESGISQVENILRLQKIGFKGFLIGENFMKSTDIFEQTNAFIQAIEAKN